jgi:chromosome segregation ATPase
LLDRTLQDQTDQAFGDIQNQLSQAESELNKALDRNASMEQQQAQLNDQIKELKQEINSLHLNMTLLDQEKDRLLVSEIFQEIYYYFKRLFMKL